jgi:excisionase family DNA binding protein
MTVGYGNILHAMIKHDFTQLMTEKEVAEFLNVPIHYLRKLRYAGKIPFMRLGHNTIRLNPDRVLEALSKLEVKEVA